MSWISTDVFTRNMFVGDGKILAKMTVKPALGQAQLVQSFQKIEDMKAANVEPDAICNDMRACFGNWMVESMKYRGAWKSVSIVDRLQIHVVDGLPGAGKSFQLKHMYEKLIGDHRRSNKPATMFTLLCEVFEVLNGAGFFNHADDPYLMCYEMALVIDGFKRVHASIAFSVQMEELGFLPTFKHVILFDGGPQRANAFFNFQKNGADVPYFDDICKIWREYFGDVTFAYIFGCPWMERVQQLQIRAQDFPNRSWEVKSWGNDQVAMIRLNGCMEQNLGKLLTHGSSGVRGAVPRRDKSTPMLHEVFQDLVLETVEPFTSEVGWWRIAVRMGNDAKARAECETYVFARSFAGCPFAKRLTILRQAFSSRFALGCATVVPNGCEHVCDQIVRIVAEHAGLMDDDLQGQFENMNQVLSMFASSGYCLEWARLAQKEIRDTLSSFVPPGDEDEFSIKVVPCS